MASVATHRPTTGYPRHAPLEQGDHLDQATFHARYEAMPSDSKAELIDGKVFLPSARHRHGRGTSLANTWLASYEANTPGVEALDNTTFVLSHENEPQPDACLVVLPERGGNTSVSEDDGMQGPPELIVEVAASSVAYDLHEKKDVYARFGVREYIAVLVWDQGIRWFVLRDGEYVEKNPDADGIYRSEVFPGLWLNAQAMLAFDKRAVLATLQQGIATPEHAEFVVRLNPDAA